MSERLPTIAATDLEAIAGTLHITDFDGGLTTPWKPNAEQIQMWRDEERHLRNFIAKSRRVGASTAKDLSNPMRVLLWDELGHRTRAGIVFHVEDKAKERIYQMHSFLEQMGAEHEWNSLSISFPNRSEIVGITAGGNRATSGEGFQLMRWEELSFYQGDAYGHISPSVGKGAPEDIVTTIDMAGANGPQARRLWRSENGFHKRFFPFERHEAYRTSLVDAEKLTAEEWAWAQAEGFTIRQAAAYWLHEIVPNKCAGDTMRAMREYPQREEHMFQASASRWVRTTPATRQHVNVHKTHGVDGDVWQTLIYTPPDEGSGQYLIGVDTATGKELDRSVVAVVDKRDGRLCACFVSNIVLMDDLARIAFDLWNVYQSTGRMGEAYRATVIIEDNGVGESTCLAAMRLGLPYERHHTDEENKYEGLLMSKRAVESGTLTGPTDLAEECDELHRDELGRFKGRKDLLMAYGFCALRRRVDAFREPLQPQDDRVRHNRRVILEQARRRARGMMR